MPRQPDFFRQFEAAAAALGITPAAFAAQLEEGARQPGRTGDEVHEWLEAKGVKASRSAVYRWLQDFRLEDRTTAARELAKTFAAVTKDGVDLSDAAFGVVAQHIFELGAGDELDPDAIGKLSLALQRLTLGKKRIEDVRREMKERQEQAVSEAEKLEKARGGDGSVVNKVREILGIK